MELIDAYRLTADQFYLDRAITITDFIMSGEDSRLGGGSIGLKEFPPIVLLSPTV